MVGSITNGRLRSYFPTLQSNLSAREQRVTHGNRPPACPSDLLVGDRLEYADWTGFCLQNQVPSRIEVHLGCPRIGHPDLNRGSLPAAS